MITVDGDVGIVTTDDVIMVILLLQAVPLSSSPPTPKLKPPSMLFMEVRPCL